MKLRWKAGLSGGPVSEKNFREVKLNKAIEKILRF